MRVAYIRHDPFGSVRASDSIQPRLDVVDKGDRFAVKVDLPGITKEDISVAVEGARLSVSGAARPSENAAAPEQIKVLHSERRAAKYARTVHLPAEVDGNAAEAAFENGVLTLSLPKRVQASQIAVR